MFEPDSLPAGPPLALRPISLRKVQRSFNKLCAFGCLDPPTARAGETKYRRGQILNFTLTFATRHAHNIFHRQLRISANRSLRSWVSHSLSFLFLPSPFLLHMRKTFTQERVWGTRLGESHTSFRSHRECMEESYEYANVGKTR